MKKIFIVWCLSASTLQWAPAQRSASDLSPHRLFREACEMYNDANFAGCIHRITEYKKGATDPDFIQESEWLLAVCAYKMGTPGSDLALKEYAETYPDSRHKDQAYLYIGSAHFAEGEYEKAIFWLKQTNIDNLSLKEQDDQAYRMAYSSMKTNDKNEAIRLFGLLKNNSAHYYSAATYYTAYLDYTDGRYPSAVSAFSSLKNHAEYRKSSLYYLTQINYIQGNNAQAIGEGEALLSNFQHDANNAEIHRILGNAYYKEGNREKAIEHLSRYSAITEKPSRDDLYTLGLAYFETQSYPSALLYLGQTTTEEDAMTQNAYLYLGYAALKSGDKKSAIMSFGLASRTSYDLKVKEAATYNYAMLQHESSVSAFGESVTLLENFLNEFPNSMYADKVNDCLVDVYLTTKNYDSALSSINKIKQPNIKILEARQKIYFHLGTVEYTNNLFETAVSWFTKCIQDGSYAMLEKANAQYWRGDSYFRLGNYPMAINDYKEFLTPGRPGDARLTVLANYNLGYCYFDQEQYEQAAVWFDHYIALEKNRQEATLADAYNRRGDCFFARRQLAKAEEDYQQAARLQPESGDYALFQSGYVLGLKHDYKGKIIQMDKLISKYTESNYLPDAYYEKGRAYVMLNDNNEAITTYKELLEQFPRSSLARKAGTQIGLLYFNQNNLPLAVTAYKKVVKDYPGSDEARVALQDLKSVYMEMNDIDAYAQYVNSLGGGATLEVSAQDSLTYLAAENLFMKGNENQAQISLRSYLTNYPQGAFSLKAQYYLGVIFYNQKAYEDAKKELVAVSAVGNTEFSEDALLRLGYIDFTQKEYQAALTSYERLSLVAEKKENKETAYLGIMRSGLALNKYAEVVQAADNLLKGTNVSPEYATEAKYSRAKSHLALQEGNKAVADLKDLGKDTRTVFGAEAKYLLGQYYFDTKQNERAEAEMNDFIKSGTPHSYWLARGFVLLSDVYASKGEDFQARQYLESLKHNYQGEDDINEMIEIRLLKLKK